MNMNDTEDEKEEFTEFQTKVGELIILTLFVIAIFIGCYLVGCKEFFATTAAMRPIVETIGKYEPIIESAVRNAGVSKDAPEVRELRASLAKLLLAQEAEAEALREKVPAIEGGACPDFAKLTRALEANSRAQLDVLEAWKRLPTPSTSTSSTSGANEDEAIRKDAGQ
jgi:hypothetical protein